MTSIGASWWASRSSVRFRWLFTFAVLVTTTLFLGAAATWALIDTRDAVAAFDERVFPGVSRLLTLTDRVMQLAANAPYLADAAVPSKLVQARADMERRKGEVRRLAEELGLQTADQAELTRALDSFEAVLTELMQVKQQDLFAREDMRAYVYQLGQLRRAGERAEWVVSPTDAQNLNVVELASAAASVFDLEQHSQRLRNADPNRMTSQHSTKLAALAASVFVLREQQLQLDNRITFLLASARLFAERLAVNLSAQVTRIQADVSARRDAATSAVRSGLLAILLISGIAIVMLIGAFSFVQGALSRLKSVTDAMRNLASHGKSRQPDDPKSPDEIGDLVAAFEVFQGDALELQRTTEHVQAQTKMLETVFNNINDGLSVFDNDMRLTRWNPQYLQILELPDGLVVQGTHITDLQQHLRNVRVNAAAGEATGAGLESFNEQRLRDTETIEVSLVNGKTLSLRSRPMPGGGFVTLYSDITERRALETQMQISQKMDVLGQLTGGVAHDFNNVLAAITSNLQLLEDRQDMGETSGRVVQRALRAAQRGAGMTRRLLAFARRQQLHPERVSVDLMLDGMRDLVAYSVRPGVTVRMDLQSAGWVTLIDRSQLERTVLNLASNASAAMPGGGELTIASQVDRQPDKSATLELSVRDTGTGMSPQILERIFEPFFTTKAASEGSGLGLSIVYGFVKQSNGEVHVTSEPGHGTTFHVRLPALAGDEPAERVETRADDEGLLNGKRILLVDDDSDVIQPLGDQLAAFGATVVTAGDRVRALEAAALEPGFDLVITDVSLGAQGDGLTLRNELEARWPWLRVVVMSGLPTDILSQRYQVDDDEAVLRKPFSKAELLNHLTRHSDRAAEGLHGGPR